MCSLTDKSKGGTLPGILSESMERHPNIDLKQEPWVRPIGWGNLS